MQHILFPHDTEQVGLLRKSIAALLLVGTLLMALGAGIWRWDKELGMSWDNAIVTDDNDNITIDTAVPTVGTDHRAVPEGAFQMLWLAGFAGLMLGYIFIIRCPHNKYLNSGANHTGLAIAVCNMAIQLVWLVSTLPFGSADTVKDHLNANRDKPSLANPNKWNFTLSATSTVSTVAMIAYLRQCSSPGAYALLLPLLSTVVTTLGSYRQYLAMGAQSG